MRNRSKLNISVYSKDEILYVRFDALTQNLNNSKAGLNEILSLADLKVVAEQFANQPYKRGDMPDNEKIIGDKRILKHLLQMSPREPQDINSLKGESIINQVMINDTSYHHTVITYRVSTVPHILLNWLACYSKFTNQANEQSIFEHIQFDDHSQFEIIGTNNNLFMKDNCRSSSVQGIMEKMLCFKDGSVTYQNALEDLEKIYKYYIESRNKRYNVTLLQCLFDKTRFDLIYEYKTQSILLKESAKEKEFKVLSSTLNKDYTSNKLEFLFMLELLNSREKIKLIESCFGKRGHDNLKYTMVHTEIQLLYFADFYVFSDGKMGIINLDRNPAYIDFYAEGKENYDILTDEFIHLAKCLELEFEADCDFHKTKQMIFTSESSLKLANLGLHINSNYSKDLFNAYNKWALFTKIRLAGDNIFKNIPEEIVDDIIIWANPTYQRSYNSQLHPGFFQAVKLGKERGYQEHQEIMGKKFQI